MKKVFLILVLAATVSALFTSCASSRGDRSGCGANKGYVGYH